MRIVVAMAAGAMLLAGCARTDAPDRPGAPIPFESESITYASGPCFGFCPVYSVTVRPDGSGVFTGIRNTEVTGERAFRMSAAEYQAFAQRLAPYRPETGSRRYAHGEPGCENAATDMPSAEITWTRPIGDSQKLYYYFGCHLQGDSPIRDAIGSAPDLLPIEGFIGERP